MSLLLEIAQLSRSTFYYHLKQMHKADKYAEEKAEISSIYHENKGRYGYRRITMMLRSRGYLLNHKTVQRLMKELGLVCRVRVKKYRSYKGEVGKIAPNLLNRNFHAEKPNQKWVTDVTEFSLFGQKLYLSPILDLHNGYLVSYAISDRPVLSMVTTMLTKAFETIPDGTGLILHSDQGWQYQHKQYQRMLRMKGIRQSMSRKGNCLDNAVMDLNINLHESLEDICQSVYRFFIRSLEESLSILDYAIIEQAVNQLIAAKTICFIGAGTSGISARYAYSRFFRIGLSCVFEADATLYRMRVATLRPGDLLFAISSSGRSSDIVNCAITAQKNGVTVISLSDFAVSPLTKNSDINLFTTPRNASLFQNIDMPLVVSQITVIDALYSCCCAKFPQEAAQIYQSTRLLQKEEKLKI